MSATHTDKHTAIVELLLTVDDLTFRAIVNDETRDFNRPSSSVMNDAVDPDEMKELLRAGIRDPQVLRRWHACVLLMHKDLEGQFAAKTADMNAKMKEYQLSGRKQRDILAEQVSFEKWRASAIRVKTGLETRLIEVRYLMDRDGITVPGEQAVSERNAAYARVHTLEEAIRRHRERTLAEVDGDFEQTEHDEELWRFVS